MTCEMRSTSRPRAATSVAIRMSILPSLSRATVCSRCALLHVAVQRGGGEAARFEALREIDGLDLGAHEHQHGVELLGLEQARERVELVQAADQPVTLADLRRGFAARLARDLARLAHVRLRDAADGVRQRRGEQRHLLLGRRLLEQAFDVVDEAHLQHLVAFVEHEELELAQSRARRSSRDR